MEPAQGEITLLLYRWKGGDPAAFEELMPLVYPHLRQVAGAYVRREKSPGVLQATALVHEVYLRLLNQKKAEWKDRSHFYAFAAKVMRMILTDHARGSQAQKRGGTAEQGGKIEYFTYSRQNGQGFFGSEFALVRVEFE